MEHSCRGTLLHWNRERCGPGPPKAPIDADPLEQKVESMSGTRRFQGSTKGERAPGAPRRGRCTRSSTDQNDTVASNWLPPRSAGDRFRRTFTLGQDQPCCEIYYTHPTTDSSQRRLICACGVWHRLSIQRQDALQPEFSEHAVSSSDDPRGRSRAVLRRSRFQQDLVG
jgi:hypothetical protein